MNNDLQPVVSVIIAFKDEEPNIAQQLEALASQDVDFPWEVILVDNGSTDRGPEIARSFQTRIPHLQIVDEREKFGPGPARNSGALWARGRYLLFCDADDVVGSDWLSVMKLGLDTTPIVAGEVDMDLLNTVDVRNSRPSAGSQGFGKEKGFYAAAGACNLGVHTSLFRELGGFKEDFDALEDFDFVFRAQMTGPELVFLADSLVHYRLRADLKGIFRQGVRNGSAGVLLRKRYVPLGMPPRTLRSTINRWGMLLLTVHHLGLHNQRRRWLFQAGLLSGILIGGIKHRVLATRPHDG